MTGLVDAWGNLKFSSNNHIHGSVVAKSFLDGHVFSSQESPGADKEDEGGGKMTVAAASGEMEAVLNVDDNRKPRAARAGTEEPSAVGGLYRG